MKQSIIFCVLMGMLLLVSCTKDNELNPLNPIQDYTVSEVDLRNGYCPDENPNIALGKEVTLHGGDFFTDGWGGGLIVDKQTIVDGQFFERGHQWDQGPVWWDSRDQEERWVGIDLGGFYKITSLIVQTDDNDAYKLLYWMNPASGSWENLWDVPNYDVVPDPDNWGMQTRPNPADDTERYCLPDPVLTTHLRFEGNMDDTDFYFAVSEIQAFGVCIVPVDIKPGSCPNPLNTKSKGVISVAVLGMPSLDVSTIDPASVRLDGVAPIRWAVEDVGTPYRPFVGKEDAYACHELYGDDIPDLTLKFNKQEIVETIGNVERGDVLVMQLTGAFEDGILFEGEDVMVVVK